MIKAEPGELFRTVFGNPWPGEAELFFKTDWTPEEKNTVGIYVRGAHKDSYDLSQMYEALCDIDVGLEPSCQSRAAAATLSSMLPEIITLETASYAVTELVRHASIFPGLPVFSILDVARFQLHSIRGSLVRKLDNSLRSPADLAQFTQSREQAMSFYISAVLKDDLEAIERLNEVPAMRELVKDSDIRAICETVDRYPDHFAVESHEFFEKLPVLSNVRNRYCGAAPIAAYYKNLKEVIKQGSLPALEVCFDPALSRRCGPALLADVLGMHVEKRLPGVMKTNELVKACAIKLINAGIDPYPAYLELTHGRFGALDFAGSAPNPREIMDRCLARRKEGEHDLTVFLLMFTPKELAAHERGQELLERLHKYTQDPKLLPFITSLQYVGKAFSTDLGL
jgi:hypothetical protein